MKSTLTKQTLTMAAARRAIDAACAKADELRIRVAITVVDESGVPRAFARMDGAPLMAIGVSRKKALTAVGFGIPSGAWFDFIKDDPILRHGVATIDDFSLLGGGVPVTVAGEVVGAIGVSGAHYSQDTQCAEAALAAVQG